MQLKLLTSLAVLASSFTPLVAAQFKVPYFSGFNLGANRVCATNQLETPDEFPLQYWVRLTSTIA